MRSTRVSFVAADAGEWRIERIVPVTGRSLPDAARLTRFEDAVAEPSGRWTLRGVRTHERYTEGAERARLRNIQPDLGRPASTRAVLIPISKSEDWWDLAQDERRAIFETRSHHIGTGLRYLPAVARRLYHGREIGAEFDFLTWFEFAPADAAGFDDLLGELRCSEEWRYVAREVEIRLAR